MLKKNCFCALKRSGHHAVMNWYFGHIKNYYFLNNINSKNTIIPEFEKLKNILNKKDFFITNIEDFDFDNPFNIQNKINYKFENYFYVLRNPFNLLASRIKSYEIPTCLEKKEICINDLILWKKFAHHFLKNNDKTILYDLWFESESYRDNISKILSFKNLNLNLDIVLNFGNGSSFDFFKFDKNAQKMNVLKRYEEFQDNQNFIEIFDYETVFLTHKIFGKKNIPKKLISRISFL